MGHKRIIEKCGTKVNLLTWSQLLKQLWLKKINNMHNNHISHTNKWFATQLIYAEA